MSTAVLDTRAIHEAFRAWQREEESLHAQLAESLAALEAYQSHLDAWQQQLARERDELRREREKLHGEAGGAAGTVPPLDVESPGTPHPPPAPTAVNGAGADRGGPPAAEPASPRAPQNIAGKRQLPLASPVLGSIVEQFGKLRQQRALDRKLAKQR